MALVQVVVLDALSKQLDLLLEDVRDVQVIVLRFAPEHVRMIVQVLAAAAAVVVRALV